MLRASSGVTLTASMPLASSSEIERPKYISTMHNLGYGVPAKQPADFVKKLTSERAAWQKRVTASGFVATN